jgi:hypothetical protein
MPTQAAISTSTAMNSLGELISRNLLSQTGPFPESPRCIPHRRPEPGLIEFCIEVVSKPRITPEGKAQADSKAQHTR